MTRRLLDFGRALRRASEREAARRAETRRATPQPPRYRAQVDGRRLSDAESDHLLRVLLFAGDPRFGGEELRS